MRWITKTPIAVLTAALLWAGSASADPANALDWELLQRDERICKNTAYIAGRVQDGERGSGTSREFAVNAATIWNAVRDNLQDGQWIHVIDTVWDTVDIASQEAGLDYVTAKGDPVLHWNLFFEDLKYEDAIDLDNGMQALLVEDMTTGRKKIIIRGTEFTQGTYTELAKDAAADATGAMTGELRVGAKQYEAARGRLAGWLAENYGNVEVIGHSLGGAIGQRLVLDYPDAIVAAKFFNSPGLEVAALQRMANPEVMQALLNEDGSRKVSIFNAESDGVGAFGSGFLLSNIVIGSGGELEKGMTDSHVGMIFGKDVKLTVQDYYSYGAERGVEGVPRGLLRSIGNTLGVHLPWDTQLTGLLLNLRDRELDYLYDERLMTAETRIGHIRTAFAMAEREMRRAEREEAEKQARFEKAVAEERREAARAARDWYYEMTEGMPTDEIAAGTLALVAEPARVLKPESAPPPRSDNAGNRDDAAGVIPVMPENNVAGATMSLTTAPVPVPTPAPAPGLFGEFSGSLTGHGEWAYVEYGTFEFTIRNRTVTGTLSAHVVAYDNVSGGDAIHGTLDGVYDPETGEITGIWSGTAGIMTDQDAVVTGRGDANGFWGNWDAGLLRGEWDASPTRAKAVTWDEAMCAKPDTRAFWLQNGGTCP